MEKNSNLNIFISKPKDFSDKAYTTKRCLEIAKKANFPTDYQDMYEHLFGNEDAELFMIMDEHKEIYGFAVCDNIVERSNTYLHGIIIHPDIQDMGFGSKLIREMIKKDNNSFLTARTHNPRVYEMMSAVAYNSNQNLVFPNVDLNEIPEEVEIIVHSYAATQNADKDLIVRDAYPDEKVSQKIKNAKIYNIFDRLNPNDAQVVVVCTKKPSWL